MKEITEEDKIDAIKYVIYQSDVLLKRIAEFKEALKDLDEAIPQLKSSKVANATEEIKRLVGKDVAKQLFDLTTKVDNSIKI